MNNIKLVFDAKLKKEIDKLYNFLESINFYKSHIKNKDRRHNINYGEIGKTGLVVHQYPYRVFKKKNGGVNFGCPLCKTIQGAKNTPMYKGTNLLWRGYIIRANDFPYMTDHLLILSSNHNHGLNKMGTQKILSHNYNVLLDMIDFHQIIGKGTLYFNHLHGNSQHHFHFHYTTSSLPIETFIYEEINSNSSKFKTKNNTNIIIFNHTEKVCFNGIYFYGNHTQLAKDVVTFIKKIIKMKYQYNIVILPPQSNSNLHSANLILYIRDKSSLSPNSGEYGASIVSGIYTIPIEKKSIKSTKIIKQVQKMCKTSIIKPTKDIINHVFKL